MNILFYMRSLLFYLLIFLFMSIGCEPEAVAEFDKLQGAAVVYIDRFFVPGEFLAEVSKNDDLFIVHKPEVDKNGIIEYLQNTGADLNHTFFIPAMVDSPWIQDYGPIFLKEDGKFTICDFEYNRQRPYDNEIPQVFARLFNVEIHHSSLINTGGNMMFNGAGIAASSDLVFIENFPYSENKIIELFNSDFNTENLIVFPEPTGNYHSHINCWAKFLSQDKIALKMVNEKKVFYNRLKKIKNEFENNDISVFEIPCPSDEPYLNSFILNNKIFVPMIGDPLNDENALEAYRKALPEYTVIGIYYHDWKKTDALHCRVLPIPADLK